MIGALSALAGASVWLLVATFLSLPVSGTHSIVGATMGYALVQHGINGVHWKKFGTIGMTFAHFWKSLCDKNDCSDVSNQRILTYRGN